MTSFFGKISDSFTFSSTKKLLNQIFFSDYELKPKEQPLQIKRILQSKSGRQTFLKELSSSSTILTKSQNSNDRSNDLSFRVLKKLSIFHHVVIYYHQYAQLVEDIKFDKLLANIDQNEWFFINVIKPYICFIQKFCLSIEMYQKLKSMPSGSKQDLFQSMCFAVNIFKNLFYVTQKLATLGRYFRSKNPKIIDYFVQLMAQHAQLMYQGFRSCIIEIIQFSKDHLSKKQDQIIMKQILSQDLPCINQQMKKLFLDKYFFPYGKGYGVKLYKLEEQNQYQVQIINGIINDHQRTERENDRREMEEALFPRNMNSRFNHADLQRSFSHSINRLQQFRNNINSAENPETGIKKRDLNTTVPNLGIGSRSQQNIYLPEHENHPVISSFVLEELQELVQEA